MEQKIGQFIASLRREKQLTQKELAERLNLTDKAVSKWECGRALPDISLLPTLAEVLGVTAGELLEGKRRESPSPETEKEMEGAISYAEHTVTDRMKKMRIIGAISFSLALVIGAMVCIICDMATSGVLSWSLFPISSIVFCWLVCFPVVRFGKRGIAGTLAMLSVFIVPFLYVLSLLIGEEVPLFPIGIRMSVISLLFLWGIFLVFRVLRRRKLLAAAITALLSIPLCLIINVSLSQMIGEPIIDEWDLLSFLLLACLAGVFFLLDYKRKRSTGH